MDTNTLCCPHDPKHNCGCWIRPETGKVERHAFRFIPGDRVYYWNGRFGAMKGVTGTVESGGERIYVKWDEHCKGWAPTAFPANFEIRHIDQ